jgi:DNA-binding beta-propeller fold protein YncE
MISVAAFAGAPADASAGSYTLFESGQARPLALSPSGALLFAANTPDGRLEVFEVKDHKLNHLTSVPVGLEPVAVAARSDNEVWVVNHLSDSVSVVSLSGGGTQGRVTRTLLVGDEPRDIVFAGPGKGRAFITTAHRGQNSPIGPQLSTPGVGRADVWVFDAASPGASLGGAPLTILTLFSDTPRALAVSPDGNRVYAAAFHSGNRTSIVADFIVPDGGEANGGVVGPDTNIEGVTRPEVGIIVQHNGSNWVDSIGRTWDDSVYFNLPDKDVFVIDATQNPPQQLPGQAGFFKSVGTILYAMAVNPVTGKVYVSNTEALNLNRFEGEGIFSNGETVRGHMHESRITVLDPAAGAVLPRHLNKHIDYSSCCAPIPNPENAKSLALPQSIAVSSDGATLYVSALGSDKIGVFKTSELENDTFVPSASSHIPVSGGGPTGLVLDEKRKQLFALTRFDNAISIVSTKTRAEQAHVPMHNPEPVSVTRGRRFFYDAALSSSHGDSSCATCHVFGDFDSLAWDLGDPDGSVLNNPQPIAGKDPTDPATPSPFLDPTFTIDFHPMKGPLMTQSLRGMANQGAMHWRGDRTGGNDEASAQPESGVFDENAAFLKFNAAFPGLLGRHEELPAADMQAFADFILQVQYPPNPIRNLDNSLTPDQQAGKDFFFGEPSLLFQDMNCESCHRIDPAANPSSLSPGFFGTDGGSSFSFISQLLKIPHLRNMYQKVGMFGLPPNFILIPGLEGHQGDQIRGFGFTHDGAFDTQFRFFSLLAFAEGPFNAGGFPAGPAGDLLKRQVEDFMFAFDSNLAPIVGQQVTLRHDNATAAWPRVDLLIARANMGECDLIAKSSIFGTELGFLYIGGGKFKGNREAIPPILDAALRLLAASPAFPVTYTCQPPGSGARAGIDRDGDGRLDGDEADAGTSPVNPNSF